MRRSALVNRGATGEFGATTLPGLALRDGVPSHLRTMVAVPTLLTTQAALEEQIERLEVHHLASPEGELYFALLSDWTDATSETVEGDDALVAAAAAGIARLNRQVRPGSRRRPLPPAPSPARLERRASALDGVGTQARQASRIESAAARRDRYDLRAGRRAGIHAESAGRRSLCHHARRRYAAAAGNRPAVWSARSRIRSTARGSIAASGRVVEGYGVLQPRVTPSLPIGREGSLFQRIFSSPSGIDPYASAVSDVYQDLFGEGSYAGKGIYDVDAFEAALDGRVAENTLLSHDLFEGIFARAGLVSDIEVVEEFPVALRRRRRAPAPLGARRLAIAAVDLRPRRRDRRRWPRRAHSADRALEDAG